MSYGVTDKGFVLKRMDTIMEEVHADLTEGFGVDTRLAESSFLNALVTTFCGQIADLWETAQDEYYSKYPSTATGINLDNAVQFGGMRRRPSSQSLYPLHCTGDDGTVVRSNAMVASDTSPEVRLYSASEFVITRGSCNAISIKVAAAQSDAVYTISINGANYSYASTDTEVMNILKGLEAVLAGTEYKASVDEAEAILIIQDTDLSRKNVVTMTENLTTSSVTSIANFYTEEYGKITLPEGIVTKMVNNISGFSSVVNLLQPIYGRLQETDIELRQSYLARTAIRSNTMIDSIVSELLNNVAGVETASGYENATNNVDARGLPPHSIEMIVEGGDNNLIAEAILRKKAGGIQTHGNIEVEVAGNYGDVIPIRFNRPEYLYTWMKVVLHGNYSQMPVNYAALTKEAIINDTSFMVAGSNLLTQLLNEGIYSAVSGITYVDIYVATSNDATYVPTEDDYKLENIIVTTRQKVLIDSSRIEVSIYDG